MLGKRPPQPQLFDVGNVYDLTLPPGSFHAQLAQAAPRLFRDEDFERLYAITRGRPSVPPSLLALTILLQQHAGVSDQEAIERTAYDLRWNAVLGRSAGTPLCAKSTLQLFRAHLILHEQARQIFVTSLDEAKQVGLLQKGLRLALDTKPILGRGAVEDTFNLLATGIRQLARALARQNGQRLDDLLRADHRQDLLAEALQHALEVFVGLLAQRLEDRIEVAPRRAEDHRDEQLLLRLEIAIKRGPGAAHAGGDFHHRGALEPQLPEDFRCHLDDGIALGFGLYAHSVCLLISIHV